VEHKGDRRLAKVVLAEMIDAESIVKLDKSVIGNDRRRHDIETAILEERCFIVKVKDKIVGFLIYDRHFFECSFISLVIISPAERRKGYASMLLSYFESVSPTDKLFSSTNESNLSMQKAFATNGFRKSGYIENLDEGDPEIIYFKSKL